MSSRIESLAKRKLQSVPDIALARNLPNFRFVAAHDLTKEPKTLEYLVRGILVHGTTAAIVGAPGTFKSFGMVDIACCVATGKPWHVRPTRQGAVFILAGEGHAGLSQRLKAWELVHGSLEGAPLYFSETGADLSDALNAAAVAAEVQRLAEEHQVFPVMVGVDTLARNFGPGDENSSSDMGRFIANLDRHIREPFGSTVLIAHHTGLMDTSRARGSSAFKAALDTEILFKRAPGSNFVTMRCTKSKDAAEFETLAFEGRIVQLPWPGEDGLPQTSFVLQPTDRRNEPVTEKLGKNELKLIATLERMYDEAQERLVLAGHDPTQALIDVKDWRRKCEMERRRFYDAKASLERKDRIVVEHPHVHLANAGDARAS